MWVRRIVFILCIGLLIVYHLFPDIVDVAKVLRLDGVSLSLFTIAIGVFFWDQVVSLGRSVRKTEKRWIVIIFCVGLVVAGLLSPMMKIDTNAIWLIGIAAIVFVLPNLRSLMPYVKKIRIGDAELELREEIGVLEKEVERAKGAVAEQGGAVVSEDAARKASSDVEKILEEAARSPRAALLLLSAKIEEQLRRVLEQAGIDHTRAYSSTRMVELGVKHQIFPPEILSAFRDFSTVRNRVAHGAAFDIDDSYILSIISLGTQLFTVVSAIEPSASSRQRPKQNVEE